MTLQASGAISFSDIQSEFGGTNPISMSEYYGEGGLPASGQISLNDFYGETSAITLTSVSATNAINNASDFPSGDTVSANSTATTTPADDGSVSYVWSRVSGSVIDSFGSGNVHTYSEFYNDGESESGTYKVVASNANGSVEDTFTVTLSYTDEGS